MAPTRVFISYKTGEDDGLTFTAHTIRQHLEPPPAPVKDTTTGRVEPRYRVWMDATSLKAGEEWNRQIYEEIPQSDVLLLLIAEATAKSNWVAREVDYAKGARVTILPVLIRSGFDTKQVLDRFDLSTVQYVSLLNGTADELGKLIGAIEELKDKTAACQKDWLGQLGRQRGRTPYRQSKREYAVFKAADLGAEGLEVEVCVAAGDMFEMGGIDVYVNSENDYMQMARIFESRTVSALIRYYGSQLDDADRILEDTIQEELDRHIKAPGIRTRPVSLGAVIATSAGRGGSYLREKCGARYVFHTATVSVEGDGIDKRLECGLRETGIRRCARATLEKVLEVDRNSGVVSPADTPQHAEQQVQAAAYKPIRSIILPLFGSGHGGRPSEEIVPALVRGVKEFLVDVAADKTNRDQCRLERIYLAAYFEEDAVLLQKALEANRTPPSAGQKPG
jgi:O-acetyl-ADP-ribose deacetylase (regulator of RNase III)